MSGNKSMTLLILLILTSTIAVDSSSLLGNLTSDVNSLKSRITTLESDSNTIASNVRSIETSIASIDGNVNKVIGGFRHAYIFVIGTVGLLFSLNIIIVYSLLKVRLIQESKPVKQVNTVKLETKEVNESVKKKKGLIDKITSKFKKKPEQVKVKSPEPVKKKSKKKKQSRKKKGGKK